MSFRARLSIFFLVIVIVPMAPLTFVLFGLIADVERGKADAGVEARRDTAINLGERARAAAARGARALGQDGRLATALQRGRTAEANRRAEALLRPLGLKRIVIGPERGLPKVDVGSRSAVFPVRQPLKDVRGRSFGTLTVSAEGPKAYARSVKRLTGLDVVVRRGGRVLAATSPEVRTAKLPLAGGDVEAGGQAYRVATFTAQGFPGAGLTVGLLVPSEPTSEDIRRAQLVAGAILLVFFVLALALAVLVSRSLQRQIAAFLEAARRLGAGDFSARVPTAGHDEFAELGTEFNRMSAQLEQRLEDLRAEQARLAGARRRIGEAVGSNLDRDALLNIVLGTAVDGAGATGGRAALQDAAGEAPRKVAEAGRLGGLQAALSTAEADALRSEAPAEAHRDRVSALAYPLRTVKGDATVTGFVSVARAERPFTESERDLFADLARQAAGALENVGLHETVERQAVTDELTGLANRRRFQETLGTELERSRRFGGSVALVMLDIDDFGRFNKSHGLATGDAVLREVGRIVRDSSREVDTPTRYGGEELAMVLPETDIEGAYNAAERVRREIETLRMSLPGGADLRLTASFGVATYPDFASDEHELIDAADTALREAKRGGKNRTVRASSGLLS